MGKERVQKIATGICFAVLFFFMLTIGLRMFVRVVVVQRLRVENNAFVNVLFFDQKQYTRTDNGGIFRMNEDGTNTISQMNHDWAYEYPFDGEEEMLATRTSFLKQKFMGIEKRVNSVITKITFYTSEVLFGRQYFVNAMYQAEKMIGWNLVAYSEYNGVVKRADGQLTEYVPQLDVIEQVQAVVGLKVFCDMQGIDFLYVQSPHTNCKYDREVSGRLDHSNQNADALLDGLADADVKYLDMRECLHADGLNHAEAFYRTDHHWKAETGLWAAGKLAEHLNENNGFSINCSMLEKNQYKFEVYPEWLLGSRGKKVTLRQTSPEDFTMIYPKYDTEIHYEVPGKGVDVCGDFSVTYDKDFIEVKDYYELNPYGAYNHSDNAVTIIQNQKAGDQGKKLLIIKDSFVNCVAPFLACVDGVAEVDVLDVRHFTGSAQSFIREKQPDIVIVWYNPSAIKEIDRTAHTSLFDFR